MRMQKPEKVPEAVVASVRKYRPELSEEEAAQLVTWDSLNGCYFIRAHGMYIGIELDGYMHT